MFHDLKFLYVNRQHGKRRLPPDMWFHTDSRTEVFSHTHQLYSASIQLNTIVEVDQWNQHLCRMIKLWVRVQYKTKIIQNSNLVTTGPVAPNNNGAETIYFHTSNLTIYFLVLLHGLGSYMLLYSIAEDSFYAMLTAFSTKHSLPVGWKGKRGFINKPVMANLIKIRAC